MALILLILYKEDDQIRKDLERLQSCQLNLQKSWAGDFNLTAQLAPCLYFNTSVAFGNEMSIKYISELTASILFSEM